MVRGEQPVAFLNFQICGFAGKRLKRERLLLKLFALKK
jgi:hypothetical protein